MAGKVKLIYTISKEMMNLINSGQASLASGGVRSATGQLLELARPCFSSVSSSPHIMSGGNLISSFTSNVQCAFIQKGVNSANVKLDDALVKLSQITDAVSGLQAVKVLSWINTAFGLINCGISIVGFHMTLSRLNNIDEALQAFHQQYSHDRRSDTFEKYHHIINDLKCIVSMLESRHRGVLFGNASFISNESSIEKCINDAEAFLYRMIQDLEYSEESKGMLLKFIFSLASILAQTINEYSSQYYYVHRTRHPMFDDWSAYLAVMNEKSFKLSVSQVLMLDAAFTDVSPLQQRQACFVLFEGVSEAKERLETCAKLVPQMTEKEYQLLDTTIDQRLLNLLKQSEIIPADLNVDQVLIQKIKDGDYQLDENGNTIIAIN